MEKEFTTIQEQVESKKQLNEKYENIKPLDMWPVREAINKNRLDEIFDTFDENASNKLTPEDKEEMGDLISQLT